jgi:hypothetical protein
LDLLDYLIDNEVDVGSPFRSTNTVDKGDLFELSVRHRNNHLPSISIHSIISNFRDGLFSIWKIHVDVFQEGVDRDLFVVEGNFYGSKQPSHVIDPFLHETYNVII